jgi:hypothetical protein
MLNTDNVRGEHILWLTPMIYTWLASFTAPVQMVLFFFDNTYYVLSFLTSAIVFIVLIGVPYMLHKHFRENETRSIIISWMHILSSVFLMLGILMIYTYTPPINREWRYYPIMSPNFERWRTMNEMAIILFQLFVGVQILFTVYGLTKLYYQRKDEQKRLQDLEYAYEMNPMVNQISKY